MRTFIDTGWLQHICPVLLKLAGTRIAPRKMLALVVPLIQTKFQNLFGFRTIAENRHSFRTKAVRQAINLRNILG